MRSRKVMKALGALGAAGLVAFLPGCPPTNTPPPSFNLIIYQRPYGVGNVGPGGASAILLNQNITPGLLDTNFNFSGPDLAPSVSQMQTFIDISSNPICDSPPCYYFPVGAQFAMSNADAASFTATFTPNGKPTMQVPIVLQRRYEAELMLRDPNELYSTLVADSGNFRWPLDARTADYSPAISLPDAIVLPSPDGAPTIPLEPVFPEDAFPAGVQLAGPGTANGYSIKAVNVWEGGLCSQEVYVKPLLDQITQQLQQTLLHSVCDAPLGTVLGFIGGGETGVDARQINATTFMTHPVGHPQDTQGGFMLNLNVKLSAYDQTIVSSDDCYIDTVYTYAMGLNQGLLSITPTRNTFNDGTNPILCHHCGAGNDSLMQALGTTLPQVFNAMAASAQTFSRPTDPLWSCNPTDPDPCRSPINLQMVQAVSSGARTLGLDLNTSNALEAEIANRANWSCISTTTQEACLPPTTTFHCGYTVRAQRIDVRPDAVEVVLFDNTAISGPFALFVASFQTVGTGNNGAPDLGAWQQVCTKQAFPRNPHSPYDSGQNFYARRFASSLLPDTACRMSGGLPLPYVPGGGCGCRTNKDCYSGACGTDGNCLYECASDLQCGPAEHCYADRGLCSSNEGCDNCHAWEVCVTDSCGNGSCVDAALPPPAPGAPRASSATLAAPSASTGGHPPPLWLRGSFALKQGPR